jgi:tryptophanyl-tRNA synthetase
MLGQPLTIGDTDFPNVWSALEYLSTLPRQGAASSPPHLGEEVNEIRAMVDKLPNVLSQYVLVDDLHATLDTFDLLGIQNHLKFWEQRFSVIAAGLHQVKALV